jgi:septum formation protein
MSQIQELVLASESPRRKDLLARAGFSFHVFSVKVSENLEKNLTSNLSIDEQILRIARRKAEATLRAYKSLKSQSFLILSADTLVILDGEALGKPKDSDQAFAFLKSLSGRSHQVKTGVVLVEGPVDSSIEIENLNPRHSLKLLQKVETTTVTFRHLNDREIRDYIESGEPMDKAGAYGIQGGGGDFVEKIVGPFDNVVGLPVETVKKMLNELK